ncbi:hypothetical protein AB0M54_12375 [Actinoplanes sp. NPDC051470]|uniref:hypothetical protein n=1 Tax=Actinoplanes sp. NPDC051470 TaxID=3157224 RepID=UPI003422FBE2
MVETEGFRSGAVIGEDEGVARRGLSDDWTIELPAGFGADLRHADGRVLLAEVIATPPARAPEALLDEILQDVHQSPEQRWREAGTDSYEVRYASWFPEDGRWALYAYTVRRGSYVQLAVLTPDPADLDWALATWRSLRFAGSPMPKRQLRPA